jgi:hypothetical protein
MTLLAVKSGRGGGGSVCTATEAHFLCVNGIVDYYIYKECYNIPMKSQYHTLLEAATGSAAQTPAAAAAGRALDG